jgi:ribosomal protein L37AE/L43A
MSSKTEFVCDHCGNHLISGGTNPEKVGWCLNTSTLTDVKWTTDLYKKLEGPHICEDCIYTISKHIGANG